MNPQRHTIAGVGRMSRLRITSTVGAVMFLWLAPLGQAQDATLASSTEPVDDVQIKVTRTNVRGPMITVPVNQGVLVDFNLPVREVRIANPEIADVSATSPKQILINGRSFGTTQLMTTLNGGQQRVFTVAVDLDLERLQASIRRMVPRAQIEVSPLMDAVVLRGTVSDAESAERIMQIAQIYSNRVINHVDVAGVQQVLLRVTVAEMNRNATRELGFNGWMAGDDFPNAFGVNNVGGINPANIGAAADVPSTATIPFLTGEDGIPISAATTMSFGFPRVQMQVFVRALRENGLLQVLAEPNLVTLSGQAASFLAGGEFPIPVPQDENVTIEFREFGVKLNFTPTVLSDDLIRLQVAPEVSEPDYSNAVQVGGFVVPGLVQRKVETVVELGPGQTFAIGGLLSETARATSTKVPGLGDLPVLGALFSSVEYQRSETELVVLVTPELVSPLAPNQVTHVPGADHVPPDDWELFGLGQIEGAGDGTEELDAGDGEWSTRSSAISGTGRTLRLQGPVGPAYGNEGL